MRKLPTVLFSVLLALFLIFLAQRFDLRSAFFPQKEVPHIRISSRATSQPVNTTAIVPQASNAPQPDTSGKIAPPDASTLRAEAERNPHQTPPSLLVFAHTVAARETEAKKSPEQAAEFFTDLSDCATGDNVPQAQALCLVTAAEIAGTYPDILKNRYDALADMTPPEARKLVQQMRALSH